MPSKTEPTPEQLALAQRNAEITSLKVAGWSIAQIAKKFGLKESRVSQILNRKLQAVENCEVQNRILLIRLELLRYDEYIKALWPAISGKHPPSEEFPEGEPYKYERGGSRVRAVETALKVGERIARLRGLDAPELSQINLNSNLNSYSVIELANEAQRIGLQLPDIPLTTNLLPGELYEQEVGQVPTKEETGIKEGVLESIRL